MKNTGDLKNVETTANHPRSIDQAQQLDGAGNPPAGTAQPEGPAGDATGAVRSARTLPAVVTRAEAAEQRLGFAMMTEAFNNDRIPKPPNWIKATRKINEMRRMQVARRRDRVKKFSEEGQLTVFEVASILKTAVTTIRTDMKVLRVKMRPVSQTPSPFQVQANFRRTQVGLMAPTGITKAEAARRLDVSEATVRRDVKIAGIDWLSDE
jgi:hypothetical protein